VSEPIIEARGLTRRFGAFTAVDALTLEVEAGTIFAFLGGNGSGKSTTIKMLIGLLQPSEGTIRVDGIDVIATPRRVRDRIGYMGQKVSLYSGITLRENVEFYAGLYGLEGEALARRWGLVRERFALAEAEGEEPADLPAGLRQRAGLALATLHEPRVLFLDEPTAGVDVHSRELFWERIQEQADAGVTVFVTTHFLEEADYCDWVSFIEAGRLVANASPEELRARFSPGYRIECPPPPGDGEAARARLVAAGFRIDPEEGAGGALALRIGALGPPALAALASVLGPEAARAVRVEQPGMNDVFRSVVASARSGAAQEAAA
jgi:drug efflux transport system ATP-binding protein